jgi:heme/copper-type cytochrome/quinol oxidase subunit 2
VPQEINTMIKTLVYGGIAAAAGVAAFLFAVIAAFLWAQQRYDTIVASGVAAGLFLLVAVIALICLAVARDRAAKRKAREEADAAAAAPSWLTDPSTLLAAVQIARTIGFDKVIPLAIAGLAAFGLMSKKRPDSKNRRTSEKDERRHAV